VRIAYYAGATSQLRKGVRTRGGLGENTPHLVIVKVNALAVGAGPVEPELAGFFFV